MTDQDLTAPEAVKRLANRLGGTPLYEGSGEESDLPDDAATTLRALSARVAELEAALEAERAKLCKLEMRCANQTRMLDAAEARERALLTTYDQERKALVENTSLRSRLKAAEAKLKEAVEVVKDGEQLISGELVGSPWKRACHSFTRRARALLASIGDKP